MGLGKWIGDAWDGVWGGTKQLYNGYKDFLSANYTIGSGILGADSHKVGAGFSQLFKGFGSVPEAIGTAGKPLVTPDDQNYVPVLNETQWSLSKLLWLYDRVQTYGIRRPITTAMLAAEAPPGSNVTPDPFDAETWRRAWNYSETVTPGQATTFEFGQLFGAVSSDERPKFDPRTTEGRKAYYDSPVFQGVSGSLDFAVTFLDPVRGAGKVFSHTVSKIPGQTLVTPAQKAIDVGGQLEKETLGKSAQLGDTLETSGSLSPATQKVYDLANTRSLNTFQRTVFNGSAGGGVAASALYDLARAGDKKNFADAMMAVRGSYPAWERLQSNAMEVAENIGRARTSYSQASAVAGYGAEDAARSAVDNGLETSFQTWVNGFAKDLETGQGFWQNVQGSMRNQKALQNSILARTRVTLHQKFVAYSPTMIGSFLRGVGRTFDPSSRYAGLVDVDAINSYRAFRYNIERSVLDSPTRNFLVAKYMSARDAAERSAIISGADERIANATAAKYGFTREEFDKYRPELSRLRSVVQEIVDKSPRHIPSSLLKEANKAFRDGRLQDGTRLKAVADQYKAMVDQGTVPEVMRVMPDDRNYLHLVEEANGFDPERPFFQSTTANLMPMMDYRALDAGIKRYLAPMKRVEDRAKGLSIDGSDFRDIVGMKAYQASQRAAAMVQALQTVWSIAAIFRPAQMVRGGADDFMRAITHQGVFTHLTSGAEGVGRLAYQWDRGATRAQQWARERLGRPLEPTPLPVDLEGSFDEPSGLAAGQAGFYQMTPRVTQPDQIYKDAKGLFKGADYDSLESGLAAGIIPLDVYVDLAIKQTRKGRSTMDLAAIVQEYDDKYITKQQMKNKVAEYAFDQAGIGTYTNPQWQRDFYDAVAASPDGIIADPLHPNSIPMAPPQLAVPPPRPKVPRSQQFGAAAPKPPKDGKDISGRQEQKAVDWADSRASLLSEIEESGIINQADSDVIRQRTEALARRLGIQDDPEVQHLIEEASSGDDTRISQAVADSAHKFGLTRQGEAREPFDPKLHKHIAGKSSAAMAGQQMDLVRPGYSFKYGDKDIQLSKPTVIEADSDFPAPNVIKNLQPNAATPHTSVRAWQSSVDPAYFKEHSWGGPPTRADMSKEEIASGIGEIRDIVMDIRGANSMTPLLFVRDELQKLGYTYEQQNRLFYESMINNAEHKDIVLFPYHNLKGLTYGERAAAIQLGDSYNAAMMVSHGRQASAEGIPAQTVGGAVPVQYVASDSIYGVKGNEYIYKHMDTGPTTTVKIDPETGAYNIDDVHDFLRAHNDQLVGNRYRLHGVRTPSGDMRISLVRPRSEPRTVGERLTRKQRQDMSDGIQNAGQGYATFATPGGQKLRVQNVFAGMEGDWTRTRIGSRTALNAAWANTVSSKNAARNIIKNSHLKNFRPGDRGYEAGWEYQTNAVVANDPVARLALEGKSYGDVMSWLDTGEGQAWVKARQQGDVNLPAQVQGVMNAATRLVPDVAGLRQRVLNHEATADDLARAFPGYLEDERVRAQMPDVLGQSDAMAFGTLPIRDWAKQKVDNAFRVMMDMPIDKLVRYPFANAEFNAVAGPMRDSYVKWAESHGKPILDSELRRIENVARQHTLDKVQQILYDTTSTTDVASTMQLFMPFSSAVADSIFKWMGLLWHKPLETVGNWAWFLNGPERAGVVYDQDGNHLTIDKNGGEVWTNPVSGEVSPSTQDGKDVVRDKHVLMRVPQMAGKQAIEKDGGKFFAAFNKDSMNPILGVPTFGPIVALPVNAFVLSHPEYGDNAFIKKFVLPFGPTSQGVGEQLAPGMVRQWFNWRDDQANQDLASSTAMEIYQTWMVEYAQHLRATAPTIEEAKAQASDEMGLRFITSPFSPVSLQHFSPYKPYTDYYRQLIRKYQGDERQAMTEFRKTAGDEFRYMTAHVTKANVSMPATQSAYKAYKDNVALVQANPDIAGLITGGDGAGSFSKAVYEWQKTIKIGGKSLRETMNIQDSIDDVDKRQDWDDFTKMMDVLTLQRRDRGITSLRQKGAQDLAAIHDTWVEQHRLTPDGSRISAWYKDYLATDGAAIQNRVQQMRNVLGNKKLVESRLDLQGLQAYVQERDHYVDVMDQYGYGSLRSKQASWLADRWDGFVDNLTGTNLAFGQLHSRWLTSDDLARTG